MTLFVNTQVKNNQSYWLAGALAGAGAGSYITWTGSVTDQIGATGGAPYPGFYAAYFGTMAAVTKLFGPTDWSNPALAAVGAPYATVGLGQWGDMLNTTSLDTIAYTFSSPVAAGATFSLVDPGASYVEYNGVETYTISATLNGAAVSTSGWTFQVVTSNGTAVASNISINAGAGTITVSSYSGNWPASVILITPNTPVSTIAISGTTIPFDFWSFNLPHLPSAILFQEVNVATSLEGMIASWQLTDSAITGGGSIANPGLVWSYMGTADFYGTGYTDIVFRNQNGMYAYWAIAGTTVSGGGNIANPGPTWSLAGLTDLNGDGLTDMLFQNMNGDLWLWAMNGSAIVGGGSLYNPGPGWKLMTSAMLGGSGGALLFEHTSGVYAEWQVSGTNIVKAFSLSAAPTGFVYAAVADLNGDGLSDVIFRNPQTGQYAAWFMSDTGYSASAIICSPGLNEVLVAPGAFTRNAAQDLIFQNTATGVLTNYAFVNGALATTTDIASPGPYFSVEHAPFAHPVAPPPTVFSLSASGDIATWSIPLGVVTASAVYPNSNSGWTFLTGADFYGLGQADILLQHSSGALGIWQTDGTQIIGGGSIGSPGGAWRYAGVGDFNGDGLSDILFTDGSGNYTSWLMNGTNVIGGGTSLGNPGPGETLVGIGDLTGSGTSDLVFQNSAGQWEVWFIANNGYAGVAQIGGAGPGWSLAGIADFNGDGRQDILLANTNGRYAIWDMNGAAVIGGPQFQGAGPAYTFVGATQVFDNREASVLFRSNASGGLVSFNLNDNGLVNMTSLGTPPAGFTATTTL